MKDKIFGLKKNIFVLGLTSLFNDFSSEMIFSVFPAFFTSVLKSGAASLGLVEGIAEGASNFIKIYSGRLSDKIQRRKIFITIGYSLSVIIRPFYVVASSVEAVLGLRFLDRVGKGLRDAPRDSIISLSSEGQELGRSFGYHRAMDTIGAILGPLAAYLILLKNPQGFNAVFMTSFAIGLLALATLFFISEVRGVIAKREILRKSFSAFTFRFKMYILSIFILATGSLPVAVILLMTQNDGLKIASIPLFYMLYNISYAAFSYQAGKISDVLGANKVLIAGYLVLVAGYALLVYAVSVPALVASFLLLGLSPALTDGVGRSFAAKLTAEEERGSAYGIFNAANGFGALLAGIGGGFIWQVFGPVFALLAGGALVVLGLAIFSLTVA